MCPRSFTWTRCSYIYLVNARWDGRTLTDQLLGTGVYAIPYRAAGVMGVGEALRDAGAAVPQGPEHDRALIDAWAQALGMSSWYAWRPYKILS